MSGDKDETPKAESSPKVEPAPIAAPPKAISVMPVTNANSLRASGSKETQHDDN